MVAEEEARRGPARVPHRGGAGRDARPHLRVRGHRRGRVRKMGALDTSPFLPPPHAHAHQNVEAEGPWSPWKAIRETTGRRISKIRENLPFLLNLHIVFLEPDTILCAQV